MVNFKRLSQLSKAADADIEKSHSEFTDAQKHAFRLGFYAGANYGMRNDHHHLRFKKGEKVEYANRIWTVDVLEGTDDNHYVLTDCNPETTSTPVMHVEFERDVLFRAYPAQLTAQEVMENYITGK